MDIYEPVVAKLSFYTHPNNRVELIQQFMACMSSVLNHSFMLRQYLYDKFILIGVKPNDKYEYTEKQKAILAATLIPEAIDDFSLYEYGNHFLNQLRDHAKLIPNKPLHQYDRFLFVNNRIEPLFESRNSLVARRGIPLNNMDDITTEFEEASRVYIQTFDDPYKHVVDKIFYNMLTIDEAMAYDKGLIKTDYTKLHAKSPQEAQDYNKLGKHQLLLKILLACQTTTPTEEMMYYRNKYKSQFDIQVELNIDRLAELSVRNDMPDKTKYTIVRRPHLDADNRFVYLYVVGYVIATKPNYPNMESIYYKIKNNIDQTELNAEIDMIIERETNNNIRPDDLTPLLLGLLIQNKREGMYDYFYGTCRNMCENNTFNLLYLSRSLSKLNLIQSQYKELCGILVDSNNNVLLSELRDYIQEKNLHDIMSSYIDYKAKLTNY